MGFPSSICRLIAACSSTCEGSTSYEENANDSFQKYIQSLETPDIHDFDAVISHYRDAVNARYDNDSTFLPTTIALANNVWHCYESGGSDPAVLQKVIDIHQDAHKRCEYVDIKPEGYFRLVLNLGKAYHDWSNVDEVERTATLLKSIEYLEHALAFAKENPGLNPQEDDAEVSLILGITSWRLCELERRDIGLDLAIRRLSVAYQCHAGFSEHSFFNEPLPDSLNLASAILYLHEAIDRSPPSTQLRDISLHHLCHALLLRYELMGKGSSKQHDLIRAEAVARTAMPIVSQDVHFKFKNTLIVITDWKDQAAHVGLLGAKQSSSSIGVSSFRVDMRLEDRQFSTPRVSRTLPHSTSQVIFTTWALPSHPTTHIQKSTKPVAFAQSIGHRVLSPPTTRKSRATRRTSASGRNGNIPHQIPLLSGSTCHGLAAYARIGRGHY